MVIILSTFSETVPKWVKKMIIIHSIFDHEGKYDSNSCSGLRVSFDQERDSDLFQVDSFVLIGKLKFMAYPACKHLLSNLSKDCHKSKMLSW